MKRLFGSLQVLFLAVALMAAPLTVSAQQYPGCEDFIHEVDDDGTHWDCEIDAASEEWCYYQCTSH